MHTPAYKPITPQQQHTNPSRNCVRTCVLDLCFAAARVLHIIAQPQIKEEEEEDRTSGILKSRRMRTRPQPLEQPPPAPEVLVEAVVPSKVAEPVPEGDGTVAASCAVVADPVVQIRQGVVNGVDGVKEQHRP